VTVSRTPLLDQLRASYERADDEVRAPMHVLLDFQAGYISSLRRQLADIAPLIGGRVLAAIAADIGRGLSRSLDVRIRETLAKHHMGAPEFTLTIPSSELRWLDPRSLENLVRESYLLKLRTDRDIGVSFHSKKIGDAESTVIVVDLPAISTEHAVSS
jgi:hypothetical protein